MIICGETAVLGMDVCRVLHRLIPSACLSRSGRSTSPQSSRATRCASHLFSVQSLPLHTPLPDTCVASTATSHPCTMHACTRAPSSPRLLDTQHMRQPRQTQTEDASKRMGAQVQVEQHEACTPEEASPSHPPPIPP
eukprot:271389-Rhodomonas_salina.1